jgi:hypothetical protein
MFRGMRLGAAVALGIVLAAGPARAADPFEIQVYDGTANPPRRFGVELHLNGWAAGPPPPEPPELPLRGRMHATLEPSFGLFPWWELGAYLQTAVRADGRFDYAGMKARSKFVTPPTLWRTVRLGVNFELSSLPERYDASRIGAEIRPIFAWEAAGWLLALNPILDVALGLPGRRDGPAFEPAVKVARTLGRAVAFGMEYYGDIGPIAHPAAPNDQEHRLFGVIDFVGLPRVEVNAGIGAGLTPASTGLVGKMILGYTFGG